MFNLGVTYRDGKFRSSLLGRAMRARPDTSGKPTSAGYFAADLDFRYEPQTDLGIFLHVNNLFDTNYQYRWGSPADGTNFLSFGSSENAQQQQPSFRESAPYTWQMLPVSCVHPVSQRMHPHRETPASPILLTADCSRR